MFPIFLSISLSVFAIAILVMATVGRGASRRVRSRLAALGRHISGADEEAIADIRKQEQKRSAIPWLNHWLETLNLGTASDLYLYQAGVKLTLGALLLISVASAAFPGYLLYYRTGDALPALILSAGLFSLPFRYVQMKRTKRLSLLEQQLPEALSGMASALRVGHSLIASLGAVAQDSPEPISSEMRKCFEEQNYGVDFRTSLTNLTRRVPVQDFRIFVAAVLIQRESGGNLAEVLEKVLQTARDRFRLKKQVSVHTAQGRMTGWILSFLPLGLGFAMYLMNPDAMSVLWKRPIGVKMLWVAGGMDFVGALIIRKIVRIQV